MSRFMMVAWAYLVAVACSGFIHVTDADVGGVRGLIAPSNLVSVLVIGLVILVPILLCQFVLLRFGWGGLVLVVVGGSFGMGIVLALMGSTAETTGGWVVSLVGSAAMFGLVMVVGVGPAVWGVVRRGRQVEGALS